MGEHIIVLTQERHRDGPWIIRLIDAIRQQDPDSLVTVLSLESVLESSSLCLDQETRIDIVPKTATVLVNRVSDAADPVLVKACIAVLGLICGDIPVVNGARAYALCTNKWCHHMLFHRAGLLTPRTKKFFRAEPITIQRAMEDWDDPVVQRFLLKPNAGGFGAGIVECRRGVTVGDLPSVSDDVILLQEYLESPHIFRVWFLDGLVLCGVVRSNPTLFNGCVVSNQAFKNFAVPDDVRQEIEQKLLPLMPDAHTGSVEYLYHDERRLYFDLNLLSTLPMENANAWAQFATSILSKSARCTR